MITNFNLDAVFKKALQNGGEFAEIFYEHTNATRIHFEDKACDQISSGIDSGVGLRIIYGNQSVYGYTTELTNKGLLELADALSKAVAGKVSYQTIAMNQVKSSFDYKIKNPPSDLNLKQKLKLVERADQAAWAGCKDLTQVSVAYIETLRKISIANSLGYLANDEKQYLTMYVQGVGTREGQTQSSYEAEGGYLGLELFNEKTPEMIANECTRRLNVLLSAKPAPAGTMPVVLSADAGGTMIHEAVGHGLEADLACNGLSVYQNKLGQSVANKLISVVDDGTMPARRGSYSVDDEGNPSKKNVLIENGILKSYMVDRLSNIKFDLPVTGNGRRESYRYKPIVRMTNTYIVPGRDNPEEILKQTKNGLFVKSMGGGQVNTVTGDFVFAVTEGYLIHNGEIGPAVKGATLTGNGPEVLNQVDRVGNDLGFAIGTCGKDGQGAPVTDAQPTIRIPQLIVGGEVPMKTYWN